MRTIRCNCGNEIETDLPDRFDTREDPELLDKIERGDFLNLRCDRCESLLKLEIPVRIVGEDIGMDIFYYPETEREQFLAGKGDFPDTADRIVFGYPELVEKTVIFRNGLNDRIIELIKYFFLRKKGNDQEISIYLDEAGETSLIFRIHGLKKDEVGMTAVDREFYRTVENDFDSILAKEPVEDIVDPPYVSVKKVILEVE